MFSEWRKRSKLFGVVCGDSTVEHMTSRERNAYDLARAAFKAGVRAGIKQEQAHKLRLRNWPFKPL